MAEVTCKFCGAKLVYDEATRTSQSAWSAPANDDVTACDPAAPGHAPSGRYVYVMRPDMTVRPRSL